MVYFAPWDTVVSGMYGRQEKLGDLIYIYINDKLLHMKNNSKAKFNWTCFDKF